MYIVHTCSKMFSILYLIWCRVFRVCIHLCSNEINNVLMFREIKWENHFLHIPHIHLHLQICMLNELEKNHYDAVCKIKLETFRIISHNIRLKYKKNHCLWAYEGFKLWHSITMSEGWKWVWYPRCIYIEYLVCDVRASNNE